MIKLRYFQYAVRSNRYGLGTVQGRPSPSVTVTVTVTATVTVSVSVTVAPYGKNYLASECFGSCESGALPVIMSIIGPRVL